MYLKHEKQVVLGNWEIEKWEFDSNIKLCYLATWPLLACQPTWTGESVSLLELARGRGPASRTTWSRASSILTLNFGTSLFGPCLPVSRLGPASRSRARVWFIL